jgi:hypothetical protein
MRFKRTGLVALALAVSLGIMILRIHPLEPAAELGFSAVLALLGLEVILVGSYLAVTGRSVPRTRWTSVVFGVRSSPGPLSATKMRLLGGLFLLVGIAGFFTAAEMWLSRP